MNLSVFSSHQALTASRRDDGTRKHLPSEESAQAIAAALENDGKEALKPIVACAARGQTWTTTQSNCQFEDWNNNPNDWDAFRTMTMTSQLKDEAAHGDVFKVQ